MKLPKVLTRLSDLLLGRLLSLRSHKTVYSVYYSQSNFNYGRYNYRKVVNAAEGMHVRVYSINVLRDRDTTIVVDIFPYLLLESLYQILTIHHEGKFIETIYDKTHENHYLLCNTEKDKIYTGYYFHQDFMKSLSYILQHTSSADKAYLIAFMYRYYPHLLGTEEI